MNKPQEKTPEEMMAAAHPIDRMIVMASRQVKVQDLDAIELGDIEVTDPNGTVTKVAGMTFKGKRDYSGFTGG